MFRLRLVLSELERQMRRLMGPSNRSVIDPSGLFDAGWYLTQNPDVAATGIDPFVHYLRHGLVEGRDPSPLFDSKWYLAQNPNVAPQGSIRSSLSSPRASRRMDPNPLFDTKWYWAQNPDVAVQAPIRSFITSILARRRTRSEPCSTRIGIWNKILMFCGDINPLAHYLQIGRFEGRNRVHHSIRVGN
jgi:hypothetical protein